LNRPQASEMEDSVCVVDGRGKIVKEAKVASEPEARFCPRSAAEDATLCC